MDDDELVGRVDELPRERLERGREQRAELDRAWRGLGPVRVDIWAVLVR